MPSLPITLSTIRTTTTNNVTRWHCTDCYFSGIVLNNLPPLYCVRPHRTVATQLFGNQNSNTKEREFGEEIYPNKATSER